MLGVAFADPGHGLLLVKRCPPKGCRIVALGTIDRGKHWRQRGQFPEPTGRSYVGILTADRRDAFVEFASAGYRSIGYATHDGGRRWNRLPLPAHAQLAATTDGTLWTYTLNCSGHAHPRCQGQVYAGPVRRDGPFTRVSTPATGGRPITQLVAPGTSTLYLTAGAVEGGNQRVLVSADGGRSWRTAADPCGRADVGLSAPPGDNNTVWALCSSEPGAGMQPKQLFVSTDQASTWTSRPNPESGGYSVGLTVSSPTVAWRAGNGRADVFRTGNAGRTWHDLLPGTIGESAGGQEYWFDTAGTDHAWVVIGPTDRHTTPLLLRTTDGGETWTRITLRI